MGWDQIYGLDGRVVLRRIPEYAVEEQREQTEAEKKEAALREQLAKMPLLMKLIART